MEGLTINSIDIHASAFLDGLAADAFVARLADKLAGFARRAMARDPGSAFAHYICSSSFDLICSGGWFEPGALTGQVQAASGLPCSYSNAMQCATWGFLVRQHLAWKRNVRHILLSVVDGNPLGMGFWRHNPAWGRTGHRVTLVHLTVPDRLDAAATAAVSVAKCHPAAVLYDYALATQRAMARHPNHTLAIPYFEEKMRKGLRRSTGAYACLPDLYEEFGHLCGADPWMSIARDVAQAGAGKRYLASSFAAEGYCCFLSVSADAQARITIEGQP